MELIVRQFSHDRDLRVVFGASGSLSIDEVATILDGRVKRVKPSVSGTPTVRIEAASLPGGNGNRGNPSRTIPAASISRRRQ